MKANESISPYKITDYPGVTTVHRGLNVRDYVAIKAMQGILANSSYSKNNWDDEYIARTAFNIADAMIKVSEE